MCPQLIFRHFPHQHYSTFFNPETGFFARVEEPGYPEPFWSYHGPELLDIAITNWCDRQCKICYRNADKNGKHMSIENYEIVMQQASSMHVLQVALGGGNPNQHPDFCKILRLTRETYNIVPSYTTNGRGLTKDILLASKDFCGAVAVSAYSPYEEMIKAVEALHKYKIKTNIHFVLDYYTISTAIKWLEEPPSILDKINAIIFLNYKPIGRRDPSRLLLKYSDKLAHFFGLTSHKKNKFKIGFDSCLISGIVTYTDIPSVFYDGCDAGRFSMFISENMEMYPCSFMAINHKGVPIFKNNMLEEWRTGNLFKSIRNQLASASCRECKHESLCLGGCPIFPRINLCHAYKYSGS